LLNVREDVVMDVEDIAVEELEHDKGKVILLKLKDRRMIRGKLEDVDKRMNITLSDAEEISTDDQIQSLGVVLVRGDSVSIVSSS
jgi:small nuclear ribonucleoprotein (snRNP)-like protein